MELIRINTSEATSGLASGILDHFKALATDARNTLLSRAGKGSEFLGWLDLPENFTETDAEKISTEAEKVRNSASAMVVIGIGGSYLGTKAVSGALLPPFRSRSEDGNTELLYAGHHLSPDYLQSLLGYLDSIDYTLAVISKSGTTTEPAIAFRLLKRHLTEKYGAGEAARRIVAITDPAGGALRKMAEKEKYTSFSIPASVGGRFSVLTAVGLFPLAVSGIDIRALMSGAAEMSRFLKNMADPDKNPALAYAVARNALLASGKATEILVSYEPALYYFAEWWKQLFGESEGKEGKGLFPASAGFTTDLHSMGQYIQDGPRKLFETVLNIDHPRAEVFIPDDKENADGLNFLTGKNLHDINSYAATGTSLAHLSGGVPQISIRLPRCDARFMGQLIFFFEFACGISATMLGVNPYDQPGVEDYKNNMFALLGKPGYEKERAALLQRIRKET